MANAVRFLVVDGYKKEGREELAGAGCTVAGELYAKMLRELLPGAAVDIIYPADPGAALPLGKGLAQYDAVAWTGSSLNAYDDTPAVRAQVDFCRAAFTARLPSFGSCWAAQIAAVAAGGRCVPHPFGREMGICRKIRLTADGRGHPLYLGKPAVFDSFASHEDEISHLPAGALVLAGNAHSAVQAVSVTHDGGVFWAVQYHPEYDLREVARLTWVRREKLVRMGFFADVAAAESYVEQLEALHQDPSRRDIAWRLGIDSDVMDATVRRVEVRNWIDAQVLPSLRH
jgi:GMP synthase (glutamine-hydrolysing)